MYSCCAIICRTNILTEIGYCLWIRLQRRGERNQWLANWITLIGSHAFTLKIEWWWMRMRGRREEELLPSAFDGESFPFRSFIKPRAYILPSFLPSFLPPTLRLVDSWWCGTGPFLIIHLLNLFLSLPLVLRNLEQIVTPIDINRKLHVCQFLLKAIILWAQQQRVVDIFPSTGTFSSSALFFLPLLVVVNFLWKSITATTLSPVAALKCPSSINSSLLRWISFDERVPLLLTATHIFVLPNRVW